MRRTSIAWTRLWPLGSAFLLAALAEPPQASAQTLRQVGYSDLGGAGLNGPVAVVERTAIVAAGVMPAAGVHAHHYNPYPCPNVAVKIVDLSRPETPRVSATIPVPEGVIASDVAAVRVKTAFFEGNLAAVALAHCRAPGGTIERGVSYYDITDPAHPRWLGRYQADADIVRPDSIPPCGPPPLATARCASSQHSVTLVQRTDGRVLSVSTEPGASANDFPSGDLRIVDVTDPRNPRQLSAFPPPKRPIFSNNGCRPFSASHGAAVAPDGMSALLAFYDGGLFSLDITDPAAPRVLGHFEYDSTRTLEASAAYVAPASIGGKRYALLSETDWIKPATTLEISAPASIAGNKFACEAMFTLYDPENTAQIYHQPGLRVDGEVVYVGRGCPESHGPDMHATMVSASLDPYLASPRGKIALLDRGRQPTQPGLATGSGCSMSERVRRAQNEGAIAVIVAQTSTATPQAFSPDGDPAGLSIPTAMIDKGDADALRATLCPSVDSAGQCLAGARVTASLVDRAGEWGSLRLLDLDHLDQATETVYRTPESARFPSPDLGVHSPQRAAVAGQFAYVPWNSGGVRVIELTNGRLKEVASFLPPDSPDPALSIPPKAFVVSVAFLGGDTRDRPQYVVVSDVNSGIYVLEPWR